jgi:hypothetical protein
VIRARLTVFVFVFTGLAGEISDAAVINGSYMVNPTTNQIGIVNDLPSITNLVLMNGVPQTVDLFSIFSTAPVSQQPIDVSFSLTEVSGGPFGGTVQGLIRGLAGIDDLGTVSFTPATFIVPTIGELNVSLSPADFANDFNGTVLATFLLPVPEPSSFALLGLSLAGAIAASLRVSRRAAAPPKARIPNGEPEEIEA